MKQDNIGITIKELRKRNNMSQQELADKLNTTNFTISKWENNVITPDIYYLKNISKIFKISLDDLLNNRLDHKKINPIRIISVIAIVELIAIILLSSVIISNKHPVIKTLEATNNNIIIKGILIANKSFSILEINDIEYITKTTGSTKKIVPSNISATIKSNDKTIVTQTIENTDKDPIETILKNIDIRYQDNKQLENLKLIIKYQEDKKIEKIESNIK